MKFVLKWLKDKINESDRENYPRGDKIVASDSISEGNLQSSGTNFSVYKADGGFVVETSWRDKHHDRHTSLYLITEDQNFGERISQILTYEAIKR
jgi:hypothetical protein